MHRDLVLTAIVVMVFGNMPQYAEGKICPSLDIRNGVRSLEKLRNCTIIMGNLTFVLMDKVNDSSVYDEYSFPELTEIVDYMLVFRITELVSLGKLFPNLRVIRGRKLFSGYALVVYRVPHLQEIGLTNLQHIGRGAVKVDSCPKVCYVRTIDWRVLGASTLDYPAAKTPACKDEFCPNECAGYCWNNYNCQKRTSDYCPNFDDEGRCVPVCPESKVTNHETMKCVTPAECVSTLNGTWWVFNGTCINACPVLYDKDDKADGGCRYVGETYTRHCEGGVVDGLDVLEGMAGCTHIDGYLEIRISNHKLEPHLEEYLGNIVSISQYLKIGRCKPIQSLEFLKNLTVIKGEKLDNDRYSLFVFENENLRKLWNFNDNFKLTIITGTMAFHDNPQLCLSEIEALENAKGITGKADMQISQYSNGYKSVCNQKEMKISELEKNPTNVTLRWERLSESSEEMVIGYTIYYIEEDLSTLIENEETCDRKSWEGIFVRENQIVLTGLVPFTEYAYYIKTYSTLHQGEQTPIYYFTTESSEPSEPMKVEAESISDTTILLEWEPPYFRNGILSHYSIVMYRKEDSLSMIKQRNYCDYPHVLELEESIAPTNASVNATNNCTCPERTFVDLIIKDVTCNEGTNELDVCIKTIYHQHPYFANQMPKSVQTKEIPDDVLDLKEFTVPANQTTFEFTNLKHFSLYLFYVEACNIKESDDLDCSTSVFVSQRTKRRENADVVRNLKIHIDDLNAYVKWDQPKESNSVLVAYQIEYKKTDSEHSKPRFECITHDQYQELDSEYKILDLTPGTYSIRVQAISLAGPGTFSDWRDFEISDEETPIVQIIGPTLGFLAIGIIIISGYWWYRRRKARDNHLITSVNPDYEGPVYIEDHWEMDRNDIEIIRELGQGSFGMVYQGRIKSWNYPCAVKTANNQCPINSRMNFLNEAAVMKTFYQANHVIKLLGIVSRGAPSLVIMELMERGDLKSYLRRTRDSSQNITANEMYRMAAQIADGMAYLSMHKYVHRDLAARNCMVGADFTVKIGDFGMARDIYETDYYRKDTAGLLPVRWMSPESLADGVFTTDSDVWSYGVVLWEMATLAEQPYQGYSNEDVFKRVKRGLRLERPPECSDDLYDVMDSCWKWRPIERPTFPQIVDKLRHHVGEDFQLVSFVLSQPGKDLLNHAPARVSNRPAMLPQAAEDDYVAHYDPQDQGDGDNVRLYVRDPSPNRPGRYLPLENQRSRSPFHIRPGSPASSNFELDSD